jgi:hypothetical protein
LKKQKEIHIILYDFSELLNVMFKKIADWFIKIWTAIKNWFVKVYPIVKTWVITNLFMIINYIVILWSYNIVFGHDEVAGAEALLGIWIFVSLAYAGYKIFIKRN